MYDGLTEQLRKDSPDLMALVERRDGLDDAEALLSEKLKPNPHDFGILVWSSLTVVGLVVAWLRSPKFWSFVLYGVAFWAVGLLFCVFVLDSAEVQSRVAIFLYHRLREKRISNWLYHRALTIR